MEDTLFLNFFLSSHIMRYCATILLLNYALCSEMRIYILCKKYTAHFIIHYRNGLFIIHFCKKLEINVIKIVYFSGCRE